MNPRLSTLGAAMRRVFAARRAALGLFADLRRAATPAGTLPERVGVRTGIPTSTTPLAWSHALAILALRELWPASGERQKGLRVGPGDQRLRRQSHQRREQRRAVGDRLVRRRAQLALQGPGRIEPRHSTIEASWPSSRTRAAARSASS